MASTRLFNGIRDTIITPTADTGRDDLDNLYPKVFSLGQTLSWLSSAVPESESPLDFGCRCGKRRMVVPHEASPS